MRDDSSVNDGTNAPQPTWSDALRAVVLPFLVSRSAVLLVGLAAAVFIGYKPDPAEPSAWQVDADPVRNLLARWDSFWYLDIALRGYHWNGNALQQQNVVFFPLYPLLMRVGGVAIGGHPLLAGLLVSLTSFLLALTYLWRWTADHLGPDAATGTVWLLSTFPLALFFSAAYTESLFLLIVVAVCYHAEHGHFARSAALGFLAGLVRPNGLLLWIPIGWIAWVADRDRRRPMWRGLATIAPIAGVLCFSAYLGWRVGNPIAWIANQAAWPNNLGHPPPTVPSSIDLWWIPNALSLGLVLASVAPVTRLLGAAYGLFIAANIAPPLFRHGLLSMGRFTSVMFPMFAWLATRVRGRARTRLILLFAVGQAVLAALFFIWEPIV
jgi:Mannosyltransferase (PIG-V)